MKVIALVLAGGEGRRLLPVTASIPKSLVKFNGVTLIDYTLRLVDTVVDQTVVTVYYKGSLIKKYLERRWPAVICREEPFLLQTGGSLRYQAEFINSWDPAVLLVLASDHVRSINLGNAIRAHLDSGNILTILASPASPEHNQLVLKDEIVVDYLSVGAPVSGDSVSSVGEYIFSWSFLYRKLKEKQEVTFDLSWDLIFHVIKNEEEKVGVFLLDDWADLGTNERIIAYEDKLKKG